MSLLYPIMIIWAWPYPRPSYWWAHAIIWPFIIQAPRAEQQAANQLVVRQAMLALPWERCHCFFPLGSLGSLSPFLHPLVLKKGPCFQVALTWAVNHGNLWKFPRIGLPQKSSKFLVGFLIWTVMNHPAIGPSPSRQCHGMEELEQVQVVGATTEVPPNGSIIGIHNGTMDVYWCWLMLIDVYPCWLMLIDEMIMLKLRSTH